MKKIINKRNQKASKTKNSIEDYLIEILRIGKQGIKKLKSIDDLLEAIAREIQRQLDRQAE
jgi:hypothetical protein